MYAHTTLSYFPVLVLFSFLPVHISKTVSELIFKQSSLRDAKRHHLASNEKIIQQENIYGIFFF